MISSRKIDDAFISLLPDSVDTEPVKRQVSCLGREEWEKLFFLSRKAGLFPAFFTAVLRLNLPAPAQEVLAENKTLFLSNLKRNCQAERDQLAALACLRKNNIPAIALKGPVLSRYLYGDLSLRQAPCDIDILVAPGEKERAVAALGEEGYYFRPDAAGERFFYNYRNSIMLQKALFGGELTHLDLHWGFRDKFIPAHIKEFWSSASLKTCSDAQILLPSDEDLLLFLVLCAFSDFDFIQPKYLYDIHRLLAWHPGKLDWKKIRAQAAQHGLSSALYFCLSCCVGIFRTSVPEGLFDACRPSFLKRKLGYLYLSKVNILFRRERIMASYAWRYPVSSYLLTTRLGSCLRLVFKKIFISIDEVVALYPVSSSPVLLYLKRLLKPFGVKVGSS